MLLDTSGLLCYYHAGEPQHADAVMFFEAASLWLTHSCVLAKVRATLPRAEARPHPHTGVCGILVR